MERDGSAVRITNTGTTVLRACHFPSGFVERDSLDLAPGATVTATPTATSSGLPDTSIVSCTLADLPLVFHEPGRRVEAMGPVVLNAHLSDAGTNIAGAVH
jgi:hypothetical protein